jgi:hypothetical protein
MSNPAIWDDTGFKKAIKSYLDLKKNVDPKKELRRRAKNIGMRLISTYKAKGVDLNEITRKVESLRAAKRVKIRPKIRAKARLNPGKWSYDRMVSSELRARKSAKGFTATGWFPSVEQLGGKPRDKATRTGPRRGKLIEKMGFLEKSETLVNQQPGAAHVASKTQGDMQRALDAETADMVAYIARKQDEAARRSGL